MREREKVFHGEMKEEKGERERDKEKERERERERKERGKREPCLAQRNVGNFPLYLTRFLL